MEIRNSSPGAMGLRKTSEDLLQLLSQRVVGQEAAMKCIVPYIHMYRAGLAPAGRPSGVFLLLGPTGTGKTRTVEAIAETLHGSSSKLVKIDCGEFQMDHEVAKLVGSPPGYVGHRETQPMLTQRKLESASSPQCDLAIVLFDEIEKAAPSVAGLLLGILDKGVLQLGDNSRVNFEKSLIFFTSNLGAQEMVKELSPGIGFKPEAPRGSADLATRLESIALAAVRKRFSPEFINRIDAVVTYQALNMEALEQILDQQIEELQKHVNARLANRCFTLELSKESRQFLLTKGTSQEYGARELKRSIHRNLVQPLATKVAGGEFEPGCSVRVEVAADGENLELRAVAGVAAVEPQHPTILVVDDNRDLRLLLQRLLEQVGWKLLTAESALQAREILASQPAHAVLLDYLLGEEDGVKLGVELRNKFPQMQVILMTGGTLPLEEEAICEARNIPVLRKPFLVQDVLNLVRLQSKSAAAR